MTTEIKKPFYKKTSFIVCVTLLVVFAAIALAMFVLMAIRYNIYRNAVDAVNATVAHKIQLGQVSSTFNVFFNGQQLQYWTKQSVPASDVIDTRVWGNVTYYLTKTFYLEDFATKVNGTWVQNVIDNSDNEIWVYLTKPLAGNENNNSGSLIAFENLHGHIENLSFLPYALNGGSINDNIAYIACAVTFFVGTFVALVPVLFMSLAPKFANKANKNSPSTQQVQIQ